MALTMTVQPVDLRHAVVQIEGVLDFETTEPLTRTCLDLVEQGRVGLVLDMSGVGFCDSSGLNAMIKIMNRAEQADGSLSLVGTSPALARILELTGVDAVVRRYPTAAEALREQP